MIDQNAPARAAAPAAAGRRARPPARAGARAAARSAPASIPQPAAAPGPGARSRAPAPAPAPAPRRSSPPRPAPRRPRRRPPRLPAPAGEARTSRRWCASSPPSTASTSTTLTGTGVGGRIRKQDVLEAAAAQREAAAGRPGRAAAPGPAAPRQARPAAPAPEPVAGRHHAARPYREDVAPAADDRQAHGGVAADLRAAHLGGRGRRHQDRPAARPGQGRLPAARGRQAHLPAVLRARRRRGAQAAPQAQRHDQQRDQRGHLLRRRAPRHRGGHRARPARRR